MKEVRLLVLLLVSFVMIGLVGPCVFADNLRLNTVETPAQVVPGSFFSVTFKAENVGGVDLTDVVFEVDERGEFSVEGSDKQSFSKIVSGDDVGFKFVIKVDSDAESGFERLKVKYDYTESGSRKSDEESFTIQVRAIETTLIVESVESVPGVVVPGKDARVSVILRNEAGIELKDVIVKLDVSGELPFAPVEGVTERRIESISGDSFASAIFNIVALADADSGIYKVPLKISYFDEFGKSYVVNDVIALKVGSLPVLDISVEKSELVQGMKGIVSVEIVNRGLADVKFFNVEVVPSAGFDVLSAKKIYVGSVDSDDTESLDFELVVHAGQQYIVLPLQITYKDEANKDYSEMRNLSVRVYSIEEAKSLGLVKGSKVFGYVVFFVLLVVGFFVYRKIKGRRR